MVTSLMSVKLSDLVVKRRGSTILGPIDLELGSEGFTVVLGPNGAGKTTLLKVLHGVERVTRGSVDWSIPAEAAREAQSYVFQNPIMLRRTVAQNLAYPLKVHGVDKATVEILIREWAERIGLADAMDRPAPRLSGGEKQKLALGRALIRKPKVLFLDEPCANLDGRATRDIEDLLLQASKDGTKIIMTTHDLGQCRRLASDVVFLLNGKVHEVGVAESFMASPRTPEARSFLNGDILV
ncbi:ATP-binding cassette domain-containing protein [Boseongicola aestuarii]|uniref:ATP-binding cassette domain-containing protein n=1 Tax=Boseongicola aestuarii TaxID=1470561 RepID=UPI000BB455B9|nr:ATP-binding cassette domain-containing protein [Boseongicola aestuarii]